MLWLVPFVSPPEPPVPIRLYEPDMVPEPPMSLAPDELGIAGDDGVGQRRRAGKVDAAGAKGTGVAADGAIGQRGRATCSIEQVQSAGADPGGVAADGAVGQRDRAAAAVGQAAAVISGGVAVDGATSVSVAVPRR